MAVRAVIFDWGGTLTPWHSIDLGELWLAVCARHYPAEEAAANAAAVRAAEAELWREGELSHQSATMQRIFEQAGVSVSDEFLASYFEAWTPHTLTDPDVLPLLRELRWRGIKVGVLSNTMWPRSAHEQIFVGDEVLELIDGAVYTSEIDWVKPHQEAFRAVMAAVGEPTRRRAYSSATDPTTTSTAPRAWGCAPCSSRTPTSPGTRRPSRTPPSPAWPNWWSTSTAGPEHRAWWPTGNSRKKPLANREPPALTFGSPLRDGRNAVEPTDLGGTLSAFCLVRRWREDPIWFCIVRMCRHAVR